MAAPELVPGLTDPRGIELERIPIRTRDLPLTRSAWRLTVAALEGQGSITRVEPSVEEVLYRGEGIFLGWPQERLAQAYGALAPRDESSPAEFQQLG